MTLCQFDAVSKWYGPVIGLNDVTFEIEPGITGLVGPNGAGKSTLIKLLTGQLRPSLGQVRVDGRRAWSASAKRYVGYCPDVDAFYEEMSGRDFVRTVAMLHGYGKQVARERAEDVLAQVGMTDRAQRPLASYSKGMRQRIKLAQALVHDPNLIVLDEPTVALAVKEVRKVLDFVGKIKESGRACVYIEHNLAHVHEIADRLVILDRGQVVSEVQPRDMSVSELTNYLISLQHQA